MERGGTEIQKQIKKRLKRQEQKKMENTMTFDEALIMSGGLGRYQKLIAIVFILSYMTGGQLIHGLPYLEYYPQYQCWDGAEWQTCDRQTDICDKELPAEDWRIDYSSKASYRNWVDPEKLDLTCASKLEISLIASGYFLGFAISSAIIPILSDKFGRKMINLLDMVIQTVFYILAYFARSPREMMIYFTFIGASASGRSSVLINYLMEFVPRSKHNMMMTIMMCMDSFQPIYQSIYYFFLKDSDPLNIQGICLCVICIIMLLFIPESPKFYFAKRRYKQARRILGGIGRFNKVEEIDEKLRSKMFDSEAAQREAIKWSESTMHHRSTKFRGTDVPIKQLMHDESDREMIYLDGVQSELCRIWQLRRNLILLIALLSSSSFCFYFVNFLMKSVPGSLITNTILSQSSEVVARALGGLIYFKFGPRFSFILMYAISTVGSLFLTIFFHSKAAPVFIIFTKFGVSAVINLLLIAAVQLFPTQFIASVFGYSNMVGRLLTVLSSIVVELNFPTNMLVFMVVSGSGVILPIFIVTKMPKFI